MNKKLITLAVAAAMTAPAAALAEATLYGKLHVSIDYFDVDNGWKGWALNGGTDLPGSDRANRVGVKGSEDLGGGLKAIYQVEFGVPLANENDFAIANGDKGGVYMRNSFVGLAGNFGTFLVGRHDTPFKISTGKLDMFVDTMADYNGTVGFDDIRADNAITYISPSFSGFQLAGAMIPGARATVRGDGYDDSASIAEGWSLAAIYSNGPFYGSLAFERVSSNHLAQNLVLPLTTTGTVTIDGEVFDASLNAGDFTIFGVEPDDDFDKWRVGLGLLDWNGFSLSGIYENQQGGIGDVDNDLWQVQAGYAFGNNMIKAMYGSVDLDGDLFTATDNAVTAANVRRDLEGDRYTWAVGFDHNFSKRTRAYALYTQVDDDNDEAEGFASWDGFSLGMIHSF